MPQDRDKLSPITPPASVRAQTARPNEFADDDLTPVEGDPVTQMNKRAGQAASSSRAAFAMIRELRTELRQVNERDVRDHNLMMGTSGKIEARVTEIGAHVEHLREDMNDVRGKLGDVADLRESVGEVRGTLHVLVNQIEADRKEREVERREAAERERMRMAVEAKAREAEIEVKKTVEITEIEVKKTAAVSDIKVEETAKVTKLADEADEKKTSRKIKLKIVGAVVAVLGVLGTLATQC